MTLIVNEIHIDAKSGGSLAISAADSRISQPDGAHLGTRPKLFEVPHLQATVSYFGLSAYRPDGNKPEKLYLDDHLQSFIKKGLGSTLESFSTGLREYLAKRIPPVLLKHNHSGIHICGYGNGTNPDFWYFSNIQTLSGFQYENLIPHYDTPASHFLGRDAATLGWDPRAQTFAIGGARSYHNGDLQVHAIFSKRLDEAFQLLSQQSGFARHNTLENYGEYLKMKLNMIAYSYKKLAREQWVGGPIRVSVRFRRSAGSQIESAQL